MSLVEKTVLYKSLTRTRPYVSLISTCASQIGLPESENETGIHMVHMTAGEDSSHCT